MCPAAPEIGCGSRAKPILLQLERDPAVAEAWLNRAGTTMAIVWEEHSTGDLRAKSITSVFQNREIALKELNGDACEEALKDFLSGGEWFRGAAVDRLSEEEAGIIAARLVRRVKANVALSDDRANALQLALTTTFQRAILHEPPTSEQTRQIQLEREFLKAGSEHLDEKGRVALQQALALGYRPLTNER